MPRRNGRVPSYCLHRPTGQARVIVDGKHIYLGKYGSRESRAKYSRILAELAARTDSRPTPDSSPEGCDLEIDELILRYLQYAETYYSKGGKPTQEFICMVEALRPLRELLGSTPANQFGPKALKTVRQHMVDKCDLCRNVVNRRVGRIKRVFKWAVAEELVPASVWHALQTVTGLRYGRTDARETEPIRPVDDEYVEMLLPFVSPQVAAMIQVQRHTGMRPGDVVQMRLQEIDRTAEVWLYEPVDHKNRWRDHRRIIPIGPKAQSVLTPFLDRPVEAFLFSPRESEEWRLANRPAYSGKQRRTKVYPCELRARQRLKEARRRRNSKRRLRDHYDTASYRRAIKYGFQRAARAGVEIPHWHPNQLRHTRATEVRRSHGLEGAQVVLGHARADVTQVYAERNLGLAVRLAKESG